MPAYLDTYLLNGWNLRNQAEQIETAEGLQDAPGIRGEDVVVPAAHGALDLHGDATKNRRRYDVGTIQFTMSVVGVDPYTGVAPLVVDDPWLYLRRLDDLQRRFNARQLVLDHPRADGSRRTVARLAQPIKVVREPSSPLFGRFTAELVIPGAFWYDPDPVTVTTGSVTTGASLSLAALCGSAPVTDATLLFTASSNPMLTLGGTYFQYEGVISSGRQLSADCATWTLDDATGTAWTPLPESISYGPGPSWFEIDAATLPTTATFTHTGGGSATASVTARRKWLTS